MMVPVTLVTGPAVEPVSLSDFKELLRIPPADSSRDNTLTRFLVAARIVCENYTRTAYVTQTWLARLDSFPGFAVRYNRNGYPVILLPKPPFQSVVFFKYVDTAGVVQTLTRDTSYGTDPNESFYAYQLEAGAGIMPAAIMPCWARPWPPQRMVPANTLVQYRCGYGGPVNVSMTANSAILTAATFKFNPDDAPSLAGETGTAISIPGAGASAGTLNTYIASVDSGGTATLKDQAQNAVANATAWLGSPVPEPLCLAILFQAQFYHEQGAVVDAVSPRVIDALRNSGYRNLVS